MFNWLFKKPLNLPRVVRLPAKYTRYREQCEFPKEKLKDIGYKDYREQRIKFNRMDKNYCMREASWQVDGKRYCQQHAGMLLLETLEETDG